MDPNPTPRTTHDALDSMSHCLHVLTHQKRHLQDVLEHGTGTDATSLMDSVTKMMSETQAFEENLKWIERNVVLPKLMDERRHEKREKVKARIRHDRQVISDRKKIKEHLEPFLPEDGFELFRTKSIWEKVLAHLSDPSDITSAYFTCPCFAGILEERRLLMLLPESMKILLESKLMERTRYPAFIETPDSFFMIPLRRVSKSWKAIFDHLIFENEFMDDSWFTRFPVLFKFNRRRDSTEFRREGKIGRALNSEALLSEDRSSCLFRKFGVNRKNFPEGDETWHENILTFLDVVGVSVWFFKFTGKNAMDGYGHLWEMLRRMPNLKALELLHLMKPEEELSAHEMRGLREELERKPFPVLRSLQHLSVYDTNELLMQEIFRKCTHVRSLSKDVYEHPLDSEASLRGFSNLERYAECGADPPQISLGMLPSWHLKSLQLCLKEPVKCSILFPILNQFQETLENLTFSNSHPDILKDSDSVKLHLPRLKTLRLDMEIRHGTIGFDDFLPLQSLEKLTIFWYDEGSRPQDKDAMVQVFDMTKEMENSNIWKLFPHLMELELGRRLKYVKRSRVIM